MKISVDWLQDPTGDFDRVAVMTTTDEEIKQHMLQLEELGIVSVLYDADHPRFDSVLLTSIGDFFVIFEKDKK